MMAKRSCAPEHTRHAKHAGMLRKFSCRPPQTRFHARGRPCVLFSLRLRRHSTKYGTYLCVDNICVYFDLYMKIIAVCTSTGAVIVIQNSTKRGHAVNSFLSTTFIHSHRLKELSHDAAPHRPAPFTPDISEQQRCPPSQSP